MRTTCPDAFELERYHAATLDGRHDPGTADHVAACDGCRAALDDIRENLAVAELLCRASTIPPTPDRPQTVGEYRVLREIGRGGMGIVYEAEDPRLGRRIALKRMRAPQLGADDRRRFQLEARMLAALDSPHIVTIHSLEDADGYLFITTELVDGPDLRARLTHGPMTLADALRVALHVARALGAAHARGVTHQDLKPGNVVIAPDGTTKVLDFGLARAFHHRSSARPGAVARIAGTPGYMSPEQARGEPAGPAADVWALGCILFECLTGEATVAGSDADSRLDAAVNARVDMSRLPDDTPPNVCNFVDAALSVAPQSRPTDLDAVSAMLEDALDALDARGSRSLVSPPSVVRVGTLPTPIGSFVGRRSQILELRRALRSYRLVTLRGSGGCGKTRLAIEAVSAMGDRFPGGVWFVDLAHHETESEIAAELAGIIGVSMRDARDERGAIAERLDASPTLVLFDNCEACIEACATLASALLEGSRMLRVLATSRQALGIPGEKRVVVAPLALASPERARDPAALQLSEAERLFVERARAADDSFQLNDSTAPLISAVCRCLDGVPLAIELAAAQMPSLGMETLAAQLHDRFGALTGTSRVHHEHHRTLRASIDWSHDRLSPREQRGLHALGVFEGGAASDSALDLMRSTGEDRGSTILSSLCEQSLIRLRSADDEPRYELLETIRAYAIERLQETGREDSIRTFHRDQFLALAETAEPELVGAEQADWLDRLDREHGNLRSALRFSISERHVMPALRLAGALGRFWHNRGYWALARDVFADVLALPGANVSTSELGAVLLWDGCVAATQGDYDRARQSLDRCERLTIEIEDEQGIARAANALGGLCHVLGDLNAAGSHYRRALDLQRLLGSRWGESACLNNLAIVAQARGMLDAADALLAESLQIRRELGDRRGVALALNNLGKLREERGDTNGARECFDACRAMEREIGDPGLVATAVTNLGRVAARAGDVRRAHELLEEGLAIRRRLGDRWEEANSLDQIGDLARRVGHLEGSRDGYLQSLAIRVGLAHAKSTAESLRRLAILDAETGHAARAARLLGAAERARAGLHAPISVETGIPSELLRAVDALGQTVFDAERRAGWALTTDAAFELLTGAGEHSALAESPRDVIDTDLDL